MRAWLAIAALALVSRGAIADEREEAAAHFEAGRKAFDTGDYDTAVREFKAANDIKPHPDVLINIATTYERLYRADEAREYYERFIAASPGDSELRRLADKRLRVLRQLPGSIFVDPGKSGAQITVTSAPPPNFNAPGAAPASPKLPGASAANPPAPGTTPASPKLPGASAANPPAPGAAPASPKLPGATAANPPAPGAAAASPKLPGASAAPANPPAPATATAATLWRCVSPPSGGCTFKDLPPGLYHVHVVHPEHIPIDEDVALAPGESLTLPQQLQHQVETLTIFSIPDAARVFIDNREEGRTPFFKQLEVGSGRTLRLESPDYPPFVEKFDLQAGKPLYRSIRLPAPPRSGRTELLIGSMVFGGYVAGALTVAVGGSKVTNDDNGLLFILLPATVAGVGLGFLGSWALSDDRMKVGTSSMVLGGMAFGTAAGTSLALGLGLNRNEADRIHSQQSTLALSLAGGGLGLGAGILGAWLTDPSAGDASMLNSGGLWGSVTGVLLTEALSLPRAQHDTAFGWLTLGGTTTGLVVGGLLSHWFEVSRGHVLWVDLAGMLGSALGYGIGYAAGNDIEDPSNGTPCFGRSVKRCVDGARFALGGMAVGLIVAAVATRKYKYDLPRVEALLTRHGGNWAFAVPQLRIELVPRPEGREQRAVLDLFRGEF